MERDASMTKDYYSYSTATLLRYTEDCSSVVGTAATRDGESSQRNEHELSDEQGARQIGRNKSCGEKAKGDGLASQGFYWKPRKARLPVLWFFLHSRSRKFGARHREGCKAGRFVPGRPTASNAYL